MPNRIETELRDLRCFLAVAEHLSFTKAADVLDMAQPPVSQSIRRLEAGLRARLFDRTSRSVRLTFAGTALLASLQPVIHRLDTALTECHDIAHGRGGRLVAGFVGPAILGLLPRILRTFQSTNPNVTVVLRELSTVEQLDALHDGSIDIGLVRLPPASTEIKTVTLYTEPLMIALPVEHPLAARREALQPESLAGEVWVVSSAAYEPGLHAMLMMIAAQAGFQPKIGQEARLLQTLLALVAEGFGIGLVSAHASNYRDDRLAYRTLDTPFKAGMVAAWHGDRAVPAVREFIATAQDVVNHADTLPEAGI
jgi:DNA-binding transcriptional LysR family regulator